MLQRIQTLYLLLVIIALVMLTFGAKVFSFTTLPNEEVDMNVKVNVYGMQADVELAENASAQLEQEVQAFLKQKNRTKRAIAQPVVSFPFYLISIFMVLLAVATLISYKRLATQQKLGRINFMINLIAFVFALIIYYLARNQANNTLASVEVISNLGLGFFCLVISTAFAFLANIGIKRDLKLIESIDRIR